MMKTRQSAHSFELLNTIMLACTLCARTGPASDVHWRGLLMVVVVD